MAPLHWREKSDINVVMGTPFTNVHRMGTLVISERREMSLFCPSINYKVQLASYVGFVIVCVWGVPGLSPSLPSSLITCGGQVTGPPQT